MLTTFTVVQDRLLKAKREHPAARWPEVLLRRQERRAMIIAVQRAQDGVMRREH